MAKKTLADELRRMAQEMISLAARLEEKEAPEEVKKLSFTDVRKLLAEKSRAGHTAKVKELLIKHGAEKLSEIDPKEYAALAREAEVI